MSETAYILLGSNLGDREAMLNTARNQLAAVDGLQVMAASALYSSDAVEMADDNPQFLNQVVKATVKQTAEELLTNLEAIETGLGRDGKGECKNRPIDLDILLYGKHRVASERLTIPHRRLLDRSFAMIPLLQLDPDLIYPGSGRRLAEYVNDDLRKQVTIYKENGHPGD